MRNFIYSIALIGILGIVYSCDKNYAVSETVGYIDTEIYDPITQAVTTKRVQGVAVDINGIPINDKEIMDGLKKRQELEARELCVCDTSVFKMVVGYINGEIHFKTYYLSSNKYSDGETTFYGTVEGLYPNSCTFISFIRTYHPGMTCYSPTETPWWRFAPASTTIPCHLEPVHYWATARFTPYRGGTDYLCGEDEGDMRWLTNSECPCVWWF